MAQDTAPDVTRTSHCISRRRFLLGGGATVISLVAIPGVAQPLRLVRVDYPRRRIVRADALTRGVPHAFAYPYPDVRNIVVKLGAAAGGGVGPQRDIVAFNQQCTHMGGPLEGMYKDRYQVLGPCPLHLTTFDLTRHGMVVSGHATESLPQIALELDGDDIYATGVMGLVYGYSAMRVAPGG